MRRARKIKITINIDEDSLMKIRSLADQTGASYQILLNKILKEGLRGRASETPTDQRLKRLESELKRIKRRLAA